MKSSIKQTNYFLSAFVVLVYLLTPSGCLPILAAREIVYRPSPNDPYYLWQAYVTDSGLLFLCGSVDNGLEGYDRVHRVYNLELRLEETLDPQLSNEIQVVQIDEHPSLKTTKGYLSDLCQFDEKRPTKRPNEKGWIEIMLANWDEGYSEVHKADLNRGWLPEPPKQPRVVIYKVQDTDPPEYLLMGRLEEGGTAWKVLLVLGSEHIEMMW
jgi:hypothetical protein